MPRKPLAVRVIIEDERGHRVPVPWSVWPQMAEVAAGVLGIEDTDELAMPVGDVGTGWVFRARETEGARG